MRYNGIGHVRSPSESEWGYDSGGGRGRMHTCDRMRQSEII